MIIGVPKEIKNQEFRVSIIPSFAEKLINNGHSVFVERNAGLNAGFPDEEYIKVGATVFDVADEIWDKSELIVKVKEPIPIEYNKIKEKHILFTYLHLASNQKLTEALINSGATCIAYETVQNNNGQLPLLAPMSAIAGRMSVLIATNLLQKKYGGEGILASGIPGVEPGNITIIGAGNVGKNAAFIAKGIGASVTVIDTHQHTLNSIDKMFGGRVKTTFYSESKIAELIEKTDILICSALIPGAITPKIISRNTVGNMKKGSVIIDVSIDQGGCCETSKPTTHDAPYFVVSGVLHYCVTNMPGAYPQTASIALNNATHQYIEQIANLGLKDALQKDSALRFGLNIYKGNITCKPIAKSLKLEYKDLNHSKR